ncbi:MAG: DUF72 domain-containing protein [Thermoplasmatota archaeon]
MGEIKIGTCGYSYFKPEKNWKEKYESKLQAFSHSFEALELNRTFYKLPMVKTAKKWMKNAYDDFEFTLKAWQAMTHPTSSPTWRNKKDDLSESQKENFGYLRPNDEIIEAWRNTKKIAKALETEVCVIQTPGSFECTEENQENMKQLFSRIEYDDFTIAWEPRGNWKDNQDKVKEICDDLGLIHVVDIMRREPVSNDDTAYIRLHGLNEDEYDYNYDYSDEELKTLANKLEKLSNSHEKVYCMFNNYEMYENADTLRNNLNRSKE